MNQPRSMPSPQDPLIPLPDDSTWQGWRKPLSALMGLWFGAWTLGLGIWDTIQPAPMPRIIGQEAQERRQLRNNATWVDGSAMALLDSDLRMRSNLRRKLLPWYAGSLLHYFNEGGPDVTVGKEGWLYLTNRVTPGEGPYNADVEPLMSGPLATVDRRLAAQDIELVLMPVPRKGVVTSDFLPPGIDPWAGLDEHVFRELKVRDIAYVDTLRTLRSMKTEIAWFRTDSHWTFRAQANVAGRVAGALGLELAPKDRPAIVDSKARTREAQGNLNYVGIPKVHPVSRLWFRPKNTFSQELLERESREPWEPSEPEGLPDLMLVGTSFCRAGIMIPHLRNNLPVPFQDGARKGNPTLQTLALALAERADQPPTQVLAEVPLYQLFPFYRGPDAASFLADGTAKGLLQAQPGTLFEIPLPGPRRKKNAQRRLQVQPGNLVVSGDGVAEVLLELSGPKGHKVALNGELGGVQSLARFQASGKRACTPLLGAGLDDHRVSLTLNDGGKAGRLSLVTLLDLEHPARPAPAELTEGNKGWTLRYTFPEPVQAGRHAALWWKLDPEQRAMGAIKLSVLPANKQQRQKNRLQLGKIRPRRGAAILISLARPGSAWGAIEIQGQGEPPSPSSLPSLVDLPGILPR